ncbi:MAG: hypothetical protein ABIF92_02825 [archaeon]
MNREKTKLKTYEQLKKHGLIETLLKRYKVHASDIDTMYTIFLKDGASGLHTSFGITTKDMKLESIKTFLAIGAIDQLVETAVEQETPSKQNRLLYSEFQ